MQTLKEWWTYACGNLKLTCSFGVSAGWYVTALFLVWHWSSADLVLAMLFGTAAGWAAGVLLAPYEEEERRFKNISKVVSGIIGGYLLGKADRVYDLLTDKDKSGDTLILQNPMILRVIVLALGCFIVASLAVFVARTYWVVGRPNPRRTIH